MHTFVDRDSVWHNLEVPWIESTSHINFEDLKIFT